MKLANDRKMEKNIRKIQVGIITYNLMKSVIINADGRMFDKDPDVNFDLATALNRWNEERLKTKYKTKENKNKTNNKEE